MYRVISDVNSLNMSSACMREIEDSLSLWVAISNVSQSMSWPCFAVNVLDSLHDIVIADSEILQMGALGFLTGMSNNVFRFANPE